MNTYKIMIQYKGTRYQGFQIQAKGITVQGEINSALMALSKSDEVKSVGSGRTDAGVHAFAQVMRVEIPVYIPPENLAKAMNSHLPHDIKVVHAELSPLNFHPIYSAKSKEYNYVFSSQAAMTPFANELMSHFPYDLNIELMREGCKLFCGEHDFINFQCTGTDIESTVRKIETCELIHYASDGHWASLAPEYYVLRVVGNGFLKQMVRLIMGALLSLGRGKITLGDIEKSFEVPLKNRLGATAPPQGLYLKIVHY